VTAPARVRRAKDELSGLLLHPGPPRPPSTHPLDNVVAVGAGDGTVTIFVAAKRPLVVVAPANRLPRTFRGVPVIVEEAGAIRPLEPGAGRALVAAGSRHYRLTTGRIVPPGAFAIAGCALGDGGGVPAAPGTRVADTATGAIVSTGFSVGRVASVDADVKVEYEKKTVVFRRQIVVAGMHASGGAVIRDGDAAVGMVFAGNDRVAVATHLRDVLDVLGVNLVGAEYELPPWRFETPPEKHNGHVLFTRLAP
jgi:hypothetical protein